MCIRTSDIALDWRRSRNETSIRRREREEARQELEARCIMSLSWNWPADKPVSSIFFSLDQRRMNTANCSTTDERDRTMRSESYTRSPPPPPSPCMRSYLIMRFIPVSQRSESWACAFIRLLRSRANTTEWLKSSASRKFKKIWNLA